MTSADTSATTGDDDAPGDWRLRPLQSRPGFLIRRLHQIHVALFLEECASEGLTPVQYSVLTALDQMGQVEQVALSRAVGVDRTNVAEVIARLERRRFVRRRLSPDDGRKKLAVLTDLGRSVLKRVEQGAARAHERTLAALPEARREGFLDDLALLVESNNAISRSPVSG
ncbi:MarR family winged helix-turn-helix transcriptional regulator [Methylopila sp. Yamaguchi]|uniref:MarR family winged helix-turn-helix transcriptional regulator n=1 Tax=Methylopila sp. Yamaguchi TaxID=1437817 RepID=UPI000CBB7040|nr:MarR family winged helix-turn-helix transcriptional regulator [Methylopila sp. Yamaguchi]GBD47879.1 MarR family transcriptional regulator [Methylopila sp. Yamaguchi]